MDIKELIKQYALKNAVDFNGKANPGAVIGKVLASDPKLKSKIKEISNLIKETIDEVNKLSPEQQKQELSNYKPIEVKKKEQKGLSELKNAKKVVMRLAPFPSGPLHIGNARPYILNDEYVRKYNGKLLLVIDDTIGSSQKPINKDAYTLIPEGLEWLKVNFDKKIIYKSDRLKIYYKYAEELINKNKAYVCKCSSTKLRNNRAKQIECKCRSNSIKDNLKEWKLMHKKYKEGKAALRIKTSMQDPNPAFRDRVLFRIADRIHPRTKKKFRVWPLLDFSWAIDDHLLGITHILRGKELMIESKMEKYIWDIFKWKHAEIIHTGLLQLEGIKLSKSKSGKEVKKGIYKGWDDPRTWSLQSLKRRGIRPEAIRIFCLNFGLTQTEITAPVDMLYSENKKLIDSISNRYFFVENPKKIKIKNTHPLTTKAPLHPDFPKRGVREFKVSDSFYISDKLEKDKIYRFMHLFNFRNKQFLSLEYRPDLKAKMIHWLPVQKNLVKIEIVMPDAEIKKGLAEPTIKDLKENEVCQFERTAFCRLDKKGKKFTFYYCHK